MINKTIKISSLLLFSLLAVAAPAEDWFYTIKKGDTVWDISHKTLKDWRYWKEVLERNHISNAAVLKPGTRIAIPLYIVREKPAEVRVEAVQGPVTVVIADKGNRQPLKAGMVLGLGDRLISAAKGSAWLSLEDGSSILLRENSELEFTRMRRLGGEDSNSMDVQMRVRAGGIKMQANPKKNPDSTYGIKTLASNSAVRGTGFRVAVETERTRTEVLEGRVNVSNSQGEVDVPDGFGTVAVKDQPPLQPKILLSAPDLAAFPERIRYLPKNVTINSLQQARKYRVQIARDAEFLKLVLNRVVKKSLLIDQNLEDGDYYVRVRGIDRVGLEGKNAVTKLHIDARPEPPLVRAPLPGDVLHTGELEFRWADVAGVGQYLFELATEQTFAHPLLQEKTSVNHWVATIDQPGKVFFRVTSITPQGRQGPPGKANAINVLPVPKTPESKPPAVDKKVLRLAWGAVEGVAQYQVQLAADAEFQERIVDRKVSQPWVEIPRPNAGYYYFRLRAIDAEGYPGSFSPAQGFRVEPASYAPLMLFGLGALLLML